MTPRKGDRVRVTYEAEYVEQIPSFGSTRHILSADASSDRRSEYSAPPNATIEVLEDLRPGDLVLDDTGTWHLRSDDPDRQWNGFGVHNRYADIHVRRPLKVHIRDGAVISS